MISYDKYERGCQQGITYKKKKIKIKIVLTPQLTLSNQWVGVDYAARIQLLNSPPITGSIEKIKWLWWWQWWYKQ